MSPVADLRNLLLNAPIMSRAIDGMAVVAQYGGDPRGLSIILNMRAALDSGDLDLLKRWMSLLERHIKRNKAR